MHSVTDQTFIDENLNSSSKASAMTPSMGTLMATVSGLLTHRKAGKIGDPDNRLLQTTRLIAKMPTLGCVRLPPSAGEAVRLPGQLGCPTRPTFWPCCSR